MTRKHKIVEQPGASARRELSSYIYGLGISVILTCISFAVAVFVGLPRVWLHALLGMLALVQITVQFRCFLHIDLSRSKREDLQLILFTALLILIMVGGTMWILTNLDTRMMGVS